MPLISHCFFWMLLGCSWGPMWLLLSCLGAHVAVSWLLLGPMWLLLSCLRDLLGSSSAIFGASRALLGASWLFTCASGRSPGFSLTPLVSLGWLVGSREHLLRLSWIHPGPSRAHLFFCFFTEDASFEGLVPSLDGSFILAMLSFLCRRIS